MAQGHSLPEKREMSIGMNQYDHSAWVGKKPMAREPLASRLGRSPRPESHSLHVTLRSVPKEEGWTFYAFMEEMKRLQKFAIALPAEEQRGAHELIDTFMRRGYTAASLDAERVWYGPTPADQHLGPFIRSSEAVYSDITETMKGVSEQAMWRRRMGSMLGKKQTAATPEGFTPVKSGSSSSGSSHGGAHSGRRKGAGGAAPQSGQTPPTKSAKAQGKQKAKSGSNPKKTNQGPTLQQNTPTRGGCGANVVKKNIFPYEDGSFSIGPVFVKFVDVCKHLGVDPSKVCGPVMMAANADKEGNCCYHHKPGCALHQQPIVNGKPFKLDDYRLELNRLGLTGVKPELIAMCKAGKKPEGVPRMVGQTLIYPTPHFG